VFNCLRGSLIVIDEKISAKNMSIQVEVAGFGICQTATPYVVMVIFVQQPNFHAWTVYRVLNSFEALSEQLQQVIPTTPRVPQFDPSNTNLQYLEQLRDSLDSWIKTITTNEFIFRTQSMYFFLCAEANQPPPFLNIHWRNVSTDDSNTASVGDTEMEMDDLFDGNNEAPEEEHGGESDSSPVSGGDAWAFGANAQARQSPGDSAMGHAGKPSKRGSKTANHMRLQQQAMSQGAPMEEGDGLDIQSISLVKGAEFLYDREEEEERGKQQSDSARSDVSTGLVSGGFGVSGAGPSYVQTMVTAPPEPSASAIVPPLPPMPKKTISLDCFHIIKVIGKGSFGKVFLVRDKARRTLHALKVLRKDHIKKKKNVEHNKTERSVLGYVHHPFIVGLIMAFQTPDKLFFVLDYCSGGELFFHLGKAGRFTEERYGCLHHCYCCRVVSDFELF
jgi:hypothetical protein